MANVDISGLSSPEQAAVSPLVDSTLRFSHSYTTINTGPSPLFAAKLQFSIPAVLSNAAVLVGLHAYSVVTKDDKLNCSIKLVPGVHVGRDAVSEDLKGGSQDRAVCSSMLDPKCVIIECRVATLLVNEQTDLELIIDVTESVLGIEDIPEFLYITKAMISPTDSLLPQSLKTNTTAEVSSSIYPTEIVKPETEINLWLIIGSVIGGLVVFIVLGILLWKCGFFKREKKEKVDKWKRQSNFYEQRKTQRISRLRMSKPQEDEIALSL